MGVSLDRWMVYFMETPEQKWMRTGGSPISENLHMISKACHEHDTPKWGFNLWFSGRKSAKPMPWETV